MNLTVDKNYIWFAVSRKNEERKLHFYVKGCKFMELDVRLTDDEPDFSFPMDVSKYKGKTIEIKGEPEELLAAAISQSDEKPAMDYNYRPAVHFTAERGWINDPNGLIYADGVYHLYYQWNPYGTDWGNMHWGHAVSRDLITWEHRPVAMEPDMYGTIYSGSAWQDTRNSAGFGKDSLLFYYTASGGRNDWSKEKVHLHTQRLAISTDGGETLVKKETIIPNIVNENRDPKVFWHEASKAYIMAIYLDEDEFMILRSDDLLHWTESQRFSAPKMWECPNLFELPIESRSGESKWVFWSADGYYMLGDFDGRRFKPETEVLEGYKTKLGYAAQTYAGVEDRTIHVAWYRTENDKGGFRGLMSIPTELSLVETKDGLRIAFKPVRELWDRFKLEETVTLVNGKDGERSLDEDSAKQFCGGGIIRSNGKTTAIVLECESGRSAEVCISDTKICIIGSDKPAILIIDHGIIECFSEDGTNYTAVEGEEDILYQDICIKGGVKKVSLYTFDGKPSDKVI